MATTPAVLASLNVRRVGDNPPANRLATGSVGGLEGNGRRRTVGNGNSRKSTRWANVCAPSCVACVHQSSARTEGEHLARV
jgi:hypothetical protein